MSLLHDVWDISEEDLNVGLPPQKELESSGGSFSYTLPTRKRESTGHIEVTLLIVLEETSSSILSIIASRLLVCITVALLPWPREFHPSTQGHEA